MWKLINNDVICWKPTIYMYKKQGMSLNLFMFSKYERPFFLCCLKHPFLFPPYTHRKFNFLRIKNWIFFAYMVGWEMYVLRGKQCTFISRKHEQIIILNHQLINSMAILIFYTGMSGFQQIISLLISFQWFYFTI